jgi:RNA polymerase sigma-70 factor (ECF subfamily)
LALRRLGARTSDLEDLTHDVFVQVFRQLHTFDASRPMKPWLFGFAFRVLSSHRRAHRHRYELSGDIEQAVDWKPNAVELLLEEERRELAWAALDDLEIKRRAVFVLHELEGCTVPEIARTLEMPLATAYSRLRLARQDFARAVNRLRSRQR